MELLHIHELLGGGLRSPSAFLVLIVFVVFGSRPASYTSNRNVAASFLPQRQSCLETVTHLEIPPLPYQPLDH